MVRLVETVRLIGIVGVCRGTGATHLAVQMANCLVSWMQRRTAVIEWNPHGDFASAEVLMRADEHKRSGQKTEEIFRRGYSLLEVDYYKEGNPRILAGCMEGLYDDIIIDFGQMRREIREEWLRCGTKIVTASLTEWKLYAFLEFLNGEIRLGNGWIYAAAFGGEDTRRKIEQRFGISLKRIPLSVDAYAVDRRVEDSLEGILK